MNYYLEYPLTLHLVIESKFLLFRFCMTLAVSIYEKRKGKKINNKIIDLTLKVSLVVLALIIMGAIIFGFGQSYYLKEKFVRYVSDESSIVKIESRTLIDKDTFVGEINSMSRQTLYAGTSGEEYSVEIIVGDTKHSFRAIEMTQGFRLYRIEGKGNGLIYGYFKSKAFPAY